MSAAVSPRSSALEMFSLPLPSYNVKERRKTAVLLSQTVSTVYFILGTVNLPHTRLK